MKSKVKTKKERWEKPVIERLNFKKTMSGYTPGTEATPTYS